MTEGVKRELSKPLNKHLLLTHLHISDQICLLNNKNYNRLFSEPITHSWGTPQWNFNKTDFFILSSTINVLLEAKRLKVKNSADVKICNLTQNLSVKQNDNFMRYKVLNMFLYVCCNRHNSNFVSGIYDLETH